MKIKIFFSLLPILLFSFQALAFDPLRLSIKTDLPENIKHIGTAAQYYVNTIGYRVKIDYPAPQDAYQIASEELNTLSLTSELKPIDEAILSLLGEKYVLIVDHEHKMISFDMKEKNLEAN